LPGEALLGPVVDACGAQRTEQISNGGDDLIVGRAVTKTATWLPERVMIIDEGDQIAPDFTAVQGTYAAGSTILRESN
jgi:hypothetical protein